MRTGCKRLVSQLSPFNGFRAFAMETVETGYYRKTEINSTTEVSGFQAFVYLLCCSDEWICHLLDYVTITDATFKGGLFCN